MISRIRQKIYNYKFEKIFQDGISLLNMKTVNGFTYIKGGELGSGTFGTVYKVTRKIDGGIFALKSFPHDTEIDLGALREISIMKMFQGNNESIMDLVDIVMSKNGFGIIMKCYSYDLFHAITENLLDNKKRREITFQLLKALSFLKRNGVLHRDIKPDNILIDHNFKPVLADFSLSKVFRGLCTRGTHTGRIATATYRAPEVVAKKPYSFPADSWSMGVVLYEMYMNKTLPVNKDKAALRFLIHKIPKFTNTPLGNMVKGLLRIDPKIRLTPIQALRGPMFNSDYIAPVLWRTVKKCEVSKEIREWCNTFETEKEITAWAAQTYYTSVTKSTAQHSVILACKMYETELQDYEDFPEYPEEEIEILRGMKYNLFV